MILLNLNGLVRYITPKKRSKIKVGERKFFKSWGEFRAYGQTHDISEGDFDIVPVGNGYYLNRVK